MNRKAALFFLIMGLLLVGSLTAYFISHRVPMSPLNSGNTAGNMQNGGLFFEMDGKIYFSNPADDNCLYSMNLDESKPKRITTMGAKYISGADGYLYFYMDSTRKSGKVTGLGAATNQFGIYRCKVNGNDLTCLVRDLCGEVQLCGEYLYYQIKSAEGGSLHKIRCNKSKNSLVTDQLISPLCYDNGIIYYTGVNTDHNIHALFTTNGDRETTLLTGNYFFPVVQDGYIYYLDGPANYKICRTNLTTGEQEVIVSDRVDCFTVDRNYIYYSNAVSDTPSLRRCDIDGGNTLILYEGVVNSINLTSRYIYFKVFGYDDVVFHMPIDLSAPAEILYTPSK